jgi:hypothetical protein
MAVRRKQNFLNQQRLNVPDIKALESAASNDFDELLKGLVTGQNKSYFINGFEINMTGAIGSSATGLQVLVADSAVLHGTSSESGTFYTVPVGTPNEILNSNTNSRVTGSFVPGALNYVGLEYERVIDPLTTTQAYFWNPSSKSELTKTVPAAIILKYKFVITSSVWASNVLPLSVVETDASNNVISVEDSRPLLNRLGTAGYTTPDPTYSYPWTNHPEGRSENFWKSTSSSSPFRGGDKQIKNEKEWKDAIMSMIKEIKGTPYWYDINAGGSIVKLRMDLGNLVMTGSGSIEHSSTNPGQINWSSDIFFTLVTSRLSYKLELDALSSNISLNDNEVAYIKLVRGENIIPNLVFTSGSSSVKSVGGVAWTNDVQAGDYIRLSSDLDTKYVKINSIVGLDEVTLSELWPFSNTGSGGAQAQYAWGTYQTAILPSTDRHVKIAAREDVPFQEDIVWLFLRQDNAGSIARVYIRGMAGGELEEGESRQISDNQSNEILQYVGSPAEHVTTPDYLNAQITAETESITFTYPDASFITSGQSHTLNTYNDIKKYYVWFNVDSAGGDPLIGSRYGVEVAISSSDTDSQVASSVALAIDSTGEFSTIDNLDGTITVVNLKSGQTTDPTNIDVGGVFSINVDTQGVGYPNFYVTDGENLTESIKKLDTISGQLAQALDNLTSYEEVLDIISGSPSNTNEFTGPVSIGTIITIPLNSKDNSIQREYEVGSKKLKVYLNGIRFNRGEDYFEIGSAGTLSSTIQIQFPLIVGDTLIFEHDL